MTLFTAYNYEIIDIFVVKDIKLVKKFVTMIFMGHIVHAWNGFLRPVLRLVDCP